MFILRLLASFVPVLALAQSGCSVPGVQWYWDHEIQELCEKDGGVVVYEQVPISRVEIASGVLPLNWPSGRIGKGDPNIGVSPKRYMRPGAPAYEGAEIRTDLRIDDPEVWRSETPIFRSSDNKIIARMVVYFRRGGDVLPLDNRSGIYCPRNIGSQLNKLFAVSE